MRAAAALLFVAAMALAATAQGEERWRFVASRMVQYSADPDVIAMRGFEHSRQLRLCARGGPVELIDFDLRLAGGRLEDVSLRGTLRSGACTRAVSLPRRVAELRLFYQRTVREKPAWIRVEAR